MARRLEIELTSARDDGTWTWRAAGAREPKGVLDATLLPPDASIGQVLKADADFAIDGIEIVAVLAPKAAKPPRDATLELLGSRRDEPLVTSTLVSRKGRDRRDEDDRGARRDRGGRGDHRDRRPGGGRDQRGGRGERERSGDRREGRRGERGDDRRSSGSRGAEGRGGRSGRSERSGPPDRNAPKRLRAGRGHRNAALRALPEDQRRLGELVLAGGVPAVRQAIERQHQLAAREGQPKLRAEPLVALAEHLVPRLKTAEWRDRAEASLRQIDEVDLRDLRSVVTAGESAARDDESRALADQLRTALTERVDKEHAEWLRELATTLQDGRIVRALRLSSRPPKAGAPLPADLATSLAEQATAALTSEVSQDRFATLLEAVSFSPVHARVAATSIPATPSPELRALVTKIATRVPAVAAQFGLGPTSAPAAATPPTASSA